MLCINCLDINRWGNFHCTQGIFHKTWSNLINWLDYDDTIWRYQFVCRTLCYILNKFKSFYIKSSYRLSIYCTLSLSLICNTQHCISNKKNIDIKGNSQLLSNIYSNLTPTSKSHLGMKNSSNLSKKMINCIRICFLSDSVDSQSDISCISLFLSKSYIFKQDRHMKRIP